MTGIVSGSEDGGEVIDCGGTMDERAAVTLSMS
jgi:hypothetical protein